MARPSFHQLSATLPRMMADGGTVVAGDDTDEGYRNDVEVDPWVDDPDNPGQWIRSSELKARQAKTGFRRPDFSSMAPGPAMPAANTLPKMPEQAPIRQDLFNTKPEEQVKQQAAEETAKADGPSFFKQALDAYNTDIPVVSDVARKVQPLVKDAVNAQGSSILGNFVSDKLGLGVTSGDIAETLVPVTAGDFALAGLPAVSKAGAAAKAGESIAPALLKGLAEGLLPAPGDTLPDLPKTSVARKLITESPALSPEVKSGASVKTIAKIGGGADVTDEVAAAAKADNIRLDKYPEDVRGTIGQWAAEHPDEIEAAKRGVIPDAQVQDMARSLVDDVGGDFAKLQRKWKPGEAWNAEEVTAIRGVLSSKTQAVMDAAEASRLDNSAANHAKLLLAMQEQARAQEIVTGVTAESGRALRAFRQEVMDAGDSVPRMEALLKRVGRDKLDAAAEAIRNLDVNDPAAVMRFVRQFNKPSAWDYVTEFYINGLLSGPKTHMVNAISNTMNTLMSPVERGLSAAVDIPLSRIQGRGRERFFSEVPADLFGGISGLPEGVRSALSVMRNGFNPADMGKFEYTRQAFPGAAGRVIRAPSTMLEAADQLGFNVNYRAALNANIVRQARKEGYVGKGFIERVAELKANPTEALIKSARETANYRLYKGDPGKFINNLMKLREDTPVTRFVVPFLKTPANILKYGLERSPAGFANPRLWGNLRNASPEASDQIARAVLGSSVAAAIAGAVATGNLDITPGAPTDPSARDRFYREGKQPFSINIGGHWISFQRLEPLNQPLTQLAGAIDAIRNGNGDPVALATQAAMTIGQNFENQTFLTGISDLLNAADDPQRFGAAYAQRFAGNFVPASALLRQTAQAIDPTIRDPEGFREAISANIPGLSQSVPPRLTAFGEEPNRATPLSPVPVSADRQSAVDAELGRLGTEIGFVGKSIGSYGLNREQQALYQEAAGQITYERLAQLIEAQSWQDLDDGARQKVIEKARDSARDAVRDPINAMLKNEEFKKLPPENQRKVITALLQKMVPQ